MRLRENSLIGEFKLSEIANLLGSELIGPEGSFKSVSTDTRTIKHGDLFVALCGSNFDGNDYIADAQKAGSCGAIVSRMSNVDISQIHVADTTLALGKIAAMNRIKSSAKLVAITGSQGKTTIKEMVGRILGVAGDTLITQGNLNNAIGVPLTLLRLENKHRFAVVEMGANHLGEIAYSVNLAKPDVAIISNAGTAHIEGFGGAENIAIAKGEIIEGVKPDGTMVLNADDRFFNLWRIRAEAKRIVSFSTHRQDVNYFASNADTLVNGDLSFELNTPQGTRRVRLSLLGKHNIGNAVAASALAMEAGANIDQVEEGLAAMRAVKGRLQFHQGKHSGRLIDDSYNASPGSFRAAIDVLAEFPGNRILVVGDMAELGAESIPAHKELGDYARTSGIDELWVTGEYSKYCCESFGAKAKHFDSRSKLIDECKNAMGSDATLLIKGSRLAAMNEIVAALSEQ